MIFQLQKKHLIIVLINIFFVLSAFADSAKKYDISVTVSPQKYELYGTEKILFVPEYSGNKIPFHLYWNGLKKGSFLYKGASEKVRNVLDKYPAISSIVVNSMLINNRSVSFRFNEDKTLLFADYPFRKGKKYNIFLTFRSKIPDKRVMRYGYDTVDKIFFISQWYPKLGRLVGKNKWIAHPFYYAYEFSSDYSQYHLEIKLPKTYKVFSNLKKISEKENIFEGENIGDIVFGFSDKLYKFSDKVDGITLNLYTYRKFTKKDVDFIFDFVKHDFKYMQKHVGKYIYDHFNIIDSHTVGFNGEGMEYPMLIHLAQTLYMYFTTIDHELSHQWFYGMIGFNETDEGWLDEGFTSYFQYRLSEIFSKRKVFGIKYSMWDFVSLTTRIKLKDIKYKSVFSTEFLNSASNDDIMFLYYYKFPFILKMLESYVGKEKIDDIFRIIYKRYCLKHPTTSDILKIFKEKLSDNNYKFLVSNLKNNFITDIALVNKNNSLVVLKNEKFLLNPKILVKYKNGEKRILGNEKVDISKILYAKTSVMDYDVSNNFVINSNRKFYLLSFYFLALLFFFFLRRKKFVFMNLFYTLFAFLPFYFYMVAILGNFVYLKEMALPLHNISIFLMKIKNNGHATAIIFLTIFLYLIKTTLLTIKRYKTTNIPYSFFTLFFIDLINLLSFPFFILTVFLFKFAALFLLFFFAIFWVSVEPVKYFLLTGKKLDFEKVKKSIPYGLMVTILIYGFAIIFFISMLNGIFHSFTLFFIAILCLGIFEFMYREFFVRVLNKI